MAFKPDFCPKHHFNWEKKMRVNRSLVILLPVLFASSFNQWNRCAGDIVLNATQVGSDVVLSGGGTANVDGLTFINHNTNAAFLWPEMGVFLTNSDDNDMYYGGISGPTSLGPGGFTAATSGTGDLFGITFHTGFPGEIVMMLPENYVSNSSLSATTTFAGESINSLGMNPGSYTWTWGTGGNSDSFTLNVSVPEPISLPAIALISIGMLIRRRRLC